MTVETILRPYDDDAIADAAERILGGECVAIPTETVYGLAADATNGEAVARIYETKGRPSFNPLIVHVNDFWEAEEIADFDRTAQILADEFWPGPLTLVLPQNPDSPVASIVTAGLPTIAIRMPAFPPMRDLIAAVGRPLAAPSANASGRISPSRAEHVMATLNGKIGLVIDAGGTVHGLESTIVAVADDHLRLLRPGPIDRAQIEAVTGLELRDTKDGTIEAPGQLKSHYAPAKPLRLDAIDAEDGEFHIGFGDIRGDASLSADGDLVEAAALLFDALHHAEQDEDCDSIAVAPIPEEGLGAAINDRLRRAAA
ncbi:MAG: threonylcarbamoyl-AMP synthase [Sphingomonadaceae bacterium]|nr:threonylcarbamoyl-AMP synthase [Sphingomonadaceae bacterium]